MSERNWFEREVGPYVRIKGKWYRKPEDVDPETFWFSVNPEFTKTEQIEDTGRRRSSCWGQSLVGPVRHMLDYEGMARKTIRFR